MQDLRRCHRISVVKSNSCWARQHLIERFQTGLLYSESGERILDYLIFDPGLQQLSSQISQLLHVEPTVIRQDNGLAALQLIGYFFDNCNLFSSCHPIPPSPDPRAVRPRPVTGGTKKTSVKDWRSPRCLKPACASHKLASSTTSVGG